MTDKATIVLHSGELDKIYSALIIGNGALAMGMECSIYFTFWGLQGLRNGKLAGGPLSKMNMLGLGRWFMKRKMGKANVAALDAQTCVQSVTEPAASQDLVAGVD